MDSKTKNIFENLLTQVDRIGRHARQGSFKTRDRYRAAMIRFIAFLAVYFKLQKLANIQDKHITAYIEYMQAHGKSPSTIKTDLAAIRYYHDMTSESKTVLSGNGAFKLERRKIGGVDRTWTREEFFGMINIAIKLGRMNIVYTLCLARYQGLRIHEAFRLDRAAAERAIKSGKLTVKGKNGLVREIPLRPQIRRMFTKIISEVPRGEKLFVGKDEKTHLVIKRAENFIVRHRKKIESPDEQVHITYHGLRHTYAAEEYQLRVSSGMSDRQAKMEVSKLLGHSREDVVKIYIFAAKPDKDEGGGKAHE